MIKKPKRGRALPKVTFDRAFYICCEIERLNREAAAASGSRKSFLENRCRRLEAMITPPKKRKALEDRRLTVAKCLEDIQAGRSLANHTKFIAELRRKGAFEATPTLKSSTGHSLGGTRADRARPVSDTTARGILRGNFGLKGQRGKKRDSENI
jgi:hypothetical protein